MRSKRIGIVAIVACLAIACGLMVVGCGSQSQQGASSNAATSKSCYVPTKIEVYNGGELFSSVEYTLDERGAVVSQAGTYKSPQGEMNRTDEFTVDENGFPTSQTSTADGTTTEYTYEYDGQPKDGLYDSYKVASDESSTTFEYTWYPAPSVKTLVTTSEAMTMNREFDESGYCTVYSTEAKGAAQGSSSSSTAAYENDQKGNISSITVTRDIDGRSMTATFTCECDENGNIVKVMDQNGSVVRTYEYQLVKNPYEFVLATCKLNVNVLS